MSASIPGSVLYPLSEYIRAETTTPEPGRRTVTSVPISAPGATDAEATWRSCACPWFNATLVGEGVGSGHVGRSSVVVVVRSAGADPGSATTLFLHKPPSPKSSLSFPAAAAAEAAAAAASSVHSPPLSAPIVELGSAPGASTTTTTTFSASMPALTHSVPARWLTHSVSAPIGPFAAAAFAPWPILPANGVCS